MTGVLSDELRTQLMDLCQRAITGTLTLEDLRQAFAASSERVRFVQHVYEDLEDAVEHLPGHWLTGAPLRAEFIRSPQHAQLQMDLALLQNGRDLTAEVLDECHRALSAWAAPGSEDLESAVRRCLAAQGRSSSTAE